MNTPILVPEKVNESVPVELTVTPNEQPFDLALRKYITKVNGTRTYRSKLKSSKY